MKTTNEKKEIDELRQQLKGLRVSNTAMRNKLWTRTAELRNIKVRLVRLGREIEYLLDHPWAASASSRMRRR